MAAMAAIEARWAGTSARRRRPARPPNTRKSVNPRWVAATAWARAVKRRLRKPHGQRLDGHADVVDRTGAHPRRLARDLDRREPARQLADHDLHLGAGQ